jgi:sucrose phosphorylase
MVYQFPLVPLVLNALHSGNAHHLQRWAASLENFSSTNTFFNFLASHDGIGVVPARGILSEAEVNALVERTLAHGGQVSYKNNPDGSQSPYELNITYFDALSDPNDTTEDDEQKINRFMVSQAIMLTLQGVPGVYFHSLFGSHNWLEGLAQTGRARTINREKLHLADLEQRMTNYISHTAHVFQRYTSLIRQRIAQPAFHPNAAQFVVQLPDQEALFTLLRTPTNGRGQVLAIHNVSNQSQTFSVVLSELGFVGPLPLTDLLSGHQYGQVAIDRLTIQVAPYQVLWLRSGTLLG